MKYNATLKRFITDEEINGNDWLFGIPLEAWYAQFFGESFTLRDIEIDTLKDGRPVVWFDGYCFDRYWFEITPAR